jgi:hypothetical protein
MTRTHRFSIATITSIVALASAGGAGAQTPQVSLGLQAGPIATEIDSNALARQVSGAVDQTIAGAQRELRSAEARLRSAERNAQRQVQRLRNRVRALRRQLRRAIRAYQEEAIRTALAAAGGAYVVVDRAGRVLDQSGGIRIDHVGTGTYQVFWSTSRTDCMDLVASAPVSARLIGPLQVTMLGSDHLQVLVYGTSGLRNGGFFLAVSC